MRARTRKIPQRTCVGCRSVRPKGELVRIVRRPDGQVEVDPGGKMSGRGAYICPSRECLGLAFTGKRLERALQAPVDAAVVARLEDRLTEAE